MDSLAVSTGDVVEIRGKRRTTAKCLPLYPSDEGKVLYELMVLLEIILELQLVIQFLLERSKQFLLKKQ
jgi:hypothetical protein